jgi:hypothetical protein
MRRGRFRFHLGPKQLFRKTNVFDIALISSLSNQNLFELVEDADEVADEAVRLHHFGRLVLGTGGLRAIAWRSVWSLIGLFEVHGVQDRSVEAGEELLRHDQIFRLIG